jgi:hypothetical protein
MKPTLHVLIVFGLAFSGAACGGRSPEGGAENRAGGAPDAAAVADTADSYHSDHDPSAFYTRDTITFTGSYLKVDMDGLSPDQFNRVIHRLKTEKSTCGSGLTIDECLVNRPWCWVAVELLKQVIREETLRG